MPIESRSQVRSRAALFGLLALVTLLAVGGGLFMLLHPGHRAHRQHGYCGQWSVAGRGFRRERSNRARRGRSQLRPSE